MISSYCPFLVEGNATPDEIDMLWVSKTSAWVIFEFPIVHPVQISA